MRAIATTISAYNTCHHHEHNLICDLLMQQLTLHLPEAVSKIWHGTPVWFIAGNPIVSYSVQKPGVRLMFWSGRSFDEPLLTGTSRFQDASIFYNHLDEIIIDDLTRWLAKAQTIQWDYKNIVKNKGQLVRL